MTNVEYVVRYRFGVSQSAMRLAVQAEDDQQGRQKVAEFFADTFPQYELIEMRTPKSEFDGTILNIKRNSK